MLRDDAVHHRQAHAGAALRQLGGEEWLEDPLLQLGRDADAGVAHLHPDLAVAAAGPDRQIAAAGHGVGGVDDEVDEHLLELAAVAFERQLARLGHQRQTDVLAHEAAKQGGGAGHDVVEVDPLRSSQLASREQQELSGQRRTAPDVGLHLAHGLGELTRVGAARLERLGRRQQRLQQVVEVVRNAAGEAPDRLHLLHVADPLLELVTRRDVAKDDEDRGMSAVGERGRRHLDIDARAVGVQELLLDRGLRPVVGDRVAHPARDHIVKPGLDEVEDRAADHLLRQAVPEHPGAGEVAEDHDAVAVDGDSVRRQLHQPAVALLALAQRLLRSPPLGDLADDRDHLGGAAGDHAALPGAVLAGEREIVLEDVDATIGERGSEVLRAQARDVRRQHQGELPAEEAVGRQHEVLDAGRLEVEEDSVAADPEDDVGDRLEDRPVGPLARPQRLLDPLALGDVGQRADDRHSPSVPHDGRLADLRPHLPAERARKLQLVAGLRLACVDGTLRPLHADPIDRVVGGELGPPDHQLLGLAVEELPRLRAHVGEDVIGRVRVEHVGGVLDDVAQLLLARPQRLPRPGARDRHRHLTRYELQDRLVVVAVADALGVALDHEHAERRVFHLERHPEPVDGIGADELDLAAALQLGGHRGGGEQRLASTQDVLRRPAAGGLGGGHRVDLVHEVREAQPVALGVVQRDVEVAGRHQLAHRGVDLREQLVETHRRAGGLRYDVDRRLHPLRAGSGHGSGDRCGAGHPAEQRLQAEVALRSRRRDLGHGRGRAAGIANQAVQRATCAGGNHRGRGERRRGRKRASQEVRQPRAGEEDAGGRQGDRGRLPQRASRRSFAVRHVLKLSRSRRSFGGADQRCGRIRVGAPERASTTDA